MRKLKGFTLIEMMIVIAIVAIMASVAIPILNGGDLTGPKEEQQPQQQQYKAV